MRRSFLGETETDLEDMARDISVSDGQNELSSDSGVREEGRGWSFGSQVKDS